MADLRELWAAAVTSTHLEQSTERESAIDRIGAAAFGPALGGVLWRIRYAGEAHMAHTALTMLAGNLRRRWNVHPKSTAHVMVTRVAKQAMREWYHPQCRTCLGRAEVVSGDLHLVCPTCNGSGVHPYSDQERRDACMGPGAEGESWEQTWERRLLEAIGTVQGADTSTAAAMSWHLERRRPREDES